MGFLAVEDSVAKWLARNTLIIPGKSNYPSDRSKGKKCPHCNNTIFVLVPVVDPKTKKLKMVCAVCGKEVYSSRKGL